MPMTVPTAVSGHKELTEPATDATIPTESPEKPGMVSWHTCIQLFKLGLSENLNV